VFALLNKNTTLLLQAANQEDMNEWILGLDPLQVGARLSKMGK
jgi:hypothetical protein